MTSSNLAVMQPAQPRAKSDANEIAARLRATFDDSEHPVWATTLDGATVYTNPAARNVINDSAKAHDAISDLSHQRAAINGRSYDVIPSAIHDHEGESLGVLLTMVPEK